MIKKMQGRVHVYWGFMGQNRKAWRQIQLGQLKTEKRKRSVIFSTAFLSLQFPSRSQHSVNPKVLLS